MIKHISLAAVAASALLAATPSLARPMTATELHDFLHREPTKVKFNNINITYQGLIPKVQKSFLSKDRESMQPHIRAFVDRAVTFTACPECGGSRLNEAARASRIRGINIADACAMQISDLAEWVRGLDEPSVAPLLAGRARHPRPARRRRARLPQPRPAAHYAVRRRAAAAQAGHSPGREGRRLRPRRADHWPAPRRRRAAARPARPARRLWQVGHRHRAPPGGHGARRLDHRPRPRRRPRRRPDRLRGRTRRPRRGPLYPHRRAPRGLRWHLTEALADTARRVLSSVSTRPTRGLISDVVPATSTGRCKSSSEILLNLRTSVLHHVVRSQSKHPLLTDRT